MEDKSGTYEKSLSSYFSTIVGALPAFERFKAAPFLVANLGIPGRSSST
jgi:hypothetical protein